MGAFIPDEWIYYPLNTNYIFQGDNRGFMEAEATARMASIIQVRNPAYSNSDVFSGPDHYTGLTVEYIVEYEGKLSLVDGHITEEARNDWIGGPPLKTRWGTADRSGLSCEARRLGPDPAREVTRMQVICSGEAHDPLVISPDVDYRFEFELTFGRNQVEYTLTGCHDGYPAFETYLGGQAVFTRSPISSPWSMVFPCLHSIPPTSGVVR